MELYKSKYNKLLKRYYNGCKYLSENLNECDKYLPLLLQILDNINIIILENNITDTEIILNGF